MAKYTSTHSGTQELLKEKLSDIYKDSASGTLGYTLNFDGEVSVDTTIQVKSNSDPVDINIDGTTIGQLEASNDVVTVQHIVREGELTLSSASNFDVKITAVTR